MGKKRKICAKTVKENVMNNPIYVIIEKSQHNETFHKKYIKELKEIYAKTKQNEFFTILKKILMRTMRYDEDSECANRLLEFCAKFVTSFDGENSHELLLSTFSWLLETISETPLVRYRICEFVNKILNSLGTEATLEDIICDAILKYMIDRLKDISPNVRVQAILALHRLQIPDAPNDIVIKSYLFHLSNDPSPKVRQAVISSIARTFQTIPHIIERLRDIDEKVRRHTFLQMSSYSVKMYKVWQRLTFLEQGLNENSEMTKKVVVKVMLPQWFETYQKSFLTFISALKIDTELDRFINVSKSALTELFKHRRFTLNEIVKELPIAQKIVTNGNKSDSEDDQDNDEVIVNDLDKIIPLDQLTIEMTIYWSSVIEFIQEEHPGEICRVLPELTAFCDYISCYCEVNKKEMDKWENNNYNSILLLLIKILATYDFGDEIGRQNLLKLLKKLLCHYELDELVVKEIVKIYEHLITDTDARFQYFIDIIRFISDLNMSLNLLNNDRQLIEEVLKNHPDKDIEIKISSLKLKILDLREQESKYVEKKDYENAQKIAEKLIEYNEEYLKVLMPNRIQNSDGTTEMCPEMSLQFPKKVTDETTIKCLQIAFYMIVSPEVNHITPNICVLYKDFIRRNVESSHKLIREWSLKLATAISMLYQILSKDVFAELNAQFYKTYDTRIWKATIKCIFELLDRFGFKFFDIDDKQGKEKKKNRQLFSNTECTDIEEEQQSQYANGTEIMMLMTHLLETCDEICIIRAVVEGFCRLIIRGHYASNDIISKLLLKYFNPVTENEINQILGLLFEKMITQKKQDLLEPSLLPTLYTILEAPNESPLRDIKPQIVLKFVIESTRPQFCSPGLNIHNTIAISFVNALLENTTNKNLIKLLSKELIKLEVSDDPVLRNDLKVNVEKFIDAIEDKKSIKDVYKFKDMLDGKVISPNENTSVRNPDSDADDVENLTEDNTHEASKTNKPTNEIEITLHPIDEDANNNSKSEEESIANNVKITEITTSLRQKLPEKTVNGSHSIELDVQHQNKTEKDVPTSTKDKEIDNDKTEKGKELTPLTPNNNTKKKTKIPYISLNKLSESVLRKYTGHDRSDNGLLKTRSATKQHYKENNIITRKRSLERMVPVVRIDNNNTASRKQSSIPIRKNLFESSKSGDNYENINVVSTQFDIDYNDDIKSPPRSRSKTVGSSPLCTNFNINRNTVGVIKINKNKYSNSKMPRLLRGTRTEVLRKK